MCISLKAKIKTGLGFELDNFEAKDLYFSHDTSEKGGTLFIQFVKIWVVFLLDPVYDNVCFRGYSVDTFIAT